MDIMVQATLGTCEQYMNEPGAEPAEISVVISPLKITGDENGGKLQIISGCNMWRSCHNPNCWYSIAARENKKA
jgi:hypothetical protein